MKKGYAFILVTLLCISFVAALDTTIKVTSEPGKFVMIRVFEAGSKTNLVQSVFDRRVDFNNQVTITHSSEFSRLDIEVYIKNEPNGQTQHYKKYTNINAGGTFNVTLPEGASAPAAISPPAPTLNTTLNQTTNITNVSAPTITGNAIQNSTAVTKISWYYIVAGVILAGLLLGGGIAVKKRLSRSGPAAMPKTPPGSDKDPQALEMKLKETQDQLDQATKEISRIKNEDQIKELQKSIDAQQEQIRKLRQGYS